MSFQLITAYKSINEIYTFSHEEDLLGKGSYANVYCGINVKTFQTHAIKHFIKCRSNSTILRDVLYECKIMLKLHHPYISEFISAYSCENNFYLVFKLCTGGELYDEILKKGKYTENESKILIKQIMEAINYLHSNGIIHRDVKPENILYESTRKDSIIKLIDYGVSKVFNADDQNTIFTTFIASKYYVAPEVLCRPISYTNLVDCWSVGVICHVLLTGYPPYDGKSTMDVYYNIRDTEFKLVQKDWEDFTADCASFVKRLLRRNPQYRLSSLEAIKHKWLSDEFLNKFSTTNTITDPLRESKRTNSYISEKNVKSSKRISSKTLKNPNQRDSTNLN